MATRNGGPACPKVERLEELMEFVTELKHGGNHEQCHTDPDGGVQQKFEPVLQEIVEALDYLHTSLSNRKSYHQKRQAEQKLFMETAKKLLSEDELKAITQQAERMING
jgi:cytochrome c553